MIAKKFDGGGAALVRKQETEIEISGSYNNSLDGPNIKRG